jgi:protein involved in polysaccharide export with SLBB domain
MERHPVKTGSHRRFRQLWLLLPVSLLAGLSGCASILSPIDAVPAELVPPQFLAAPQANKRPIDVSLLRHLPPPSYILDKEDVLGIFVEGVLGKQDEAPPVTLPDRESDLSPGIGFPIPVRDDGTISLPLIEPIPVRGLTVAQTEELVKRRYEEEQILVRPRVTVTLLRKRTYRVFVVRQDGGVAGGDAQLGLVQRQRGVFDRSDLSSRGFVLQLPAYENDVLNALSQTGGLPGLNAKAEVTILRGDSARTEERLRQLRETYGSGMMNMPGFNPATIAGAESTVTIPLRVGPTEIPTFRPEDVILREGDVVYVESRETEVYYTGGLLGGGEWPIPRDYDLDVLGAIALAGRGIGFSQGADRGLIGGGNQVPPTELIILRKLPGNRQIPIRVDLARATNDPQSRLLVHSGDTLLLRYKPEEEIANLGISAFFTYGLSQLFNGN